MNRANRKADSAVLRCHAFIKGIHAYRWDGWAEGALAARLRGCIKAGDGLAEAYSIVKEIILRKTGLCLYDSQLLTACAMAKGHIAELPTGEGKTLAAVIAAAIFALQKRSVHILVFNDYLARRDCAANRAIYEACGLTCGYIVEATDCRHRQAAYACDIVYISAKEAGFDCLRDFLCTDADALLCPPHQVALVDEADSILIDEARTPLVLAGNAAPRPSFTARIALAVSGLSACDVGVLADSNQAWLTESGIRAMESAMEIDDLSMPQHADLLARINAAVEAKHLLARDKDYIVKDSAILVVDESTGRVAESRRFPDLLHEAVEMKELGRGSDPTTVYGSISMQAYLRQYEMLCGMTGTAASSAYELRQMYGLEIAVIPPNTPCIRIDHPDAIFPEKAEQESAILQSIQRSHGKGQPVLLGTQSVEESEHYLSLLAALGIPHHTLNARDDTQEAAIVAAAGRHYQVTISTNMAGRGVDIRLGAGDAAEAALVRASGGLSVVSTGLNRSIRIDNQLRGRAGRQGDPGESQFFLHLQGLAPETLARLDRCHHTQYPKLLRQAQRAQQRADIEARYMLGRYSSILEGQRKRIAERRLEILLGKSAPGMLEKEDAQAHARLVRDVGRRGVALAERQLALYYINQNWAAYLEAMETMRSGIHLLVIGGKSPLDEYMLFAASAYAEMLEDIQHDVAAQMMRCTITRDGIDMEREGLLGATTTWTYLINESAGQFSRIPQLIRSMTAPVQGTLFTAKGLLASLRERLRRVFPR